MIKREEHIESLHILRARARSSTMPKRPGSQGFYCPRRDDTLPFERDNSAIPPLDFPSSMPMDLAAGTYVALADVGRFVRNLTGWM